MECITVSVMLFYVTYMHSCSMFGYILVCLVAYIIVAGLISSIVHSCLVICGDHYASLMHVHVCMWSSVQ